MSFEHCLSSIFHLYNAVNCQKSSESNLTACDCNYGNLLSCPFDSSRRDGIHSRLHYCSRVCCISVTRLIQSAARNRVNKARSLHQDALSEHSFCSTNEWTLVSEEMSM